MAPIGTVCVFETLEEYIYSKKENRIPVHKLTGRCALTSLEVESVLDYLISTGWINDFQKTKKYGGLIYEIKGFRGRIEELRQILKIKFDYDSGVLFLWDTSIEIRKSKNNIPCDLLRTLLKDPCRVWNNDEILENWHRRGTEAMNALKSNQIYQAGLKVNQIIQRKIKADDFILITTKTAQINPKYLS
jgi:hypothetical protein